MPHDEGHGRVSGDRAHGFRPTAIGHGKLPRPTYETEFDPRVVKRIIQNEALSASALTSDQVESLIPTEVYRPPGEEDFGTPPDTPPESVNGECATSPCGDDGGPDPETGGSGLTTAVPETM